jgi:hypothetical protein
MLRLLPTALLLFLASGGFAQTRTFLSPGIKFGYQWDVGMFAGLEISYTIMPNSPGFIYGATFNLNLLRSGGYKVHLGVQGSSFIGGEIGPTYAKEWGKLAEWGYSASIYTLVGLMPYYTFTDLFGRKINEAGLLIKIPIQLSGRELGSLFKT